MGTPPQLAVYWGQMGFQQGSEMIVRRRRLGRDDATVAV